MSSVLRDIHHAARALRKAPVMATVAIACFAIGIGANATMIGVVNALLFRPPPHIHDANTVFRIRLTSVAPDGVQPSRLGEGKLGAIEYGTLRDGARGLDAVAAYATHELTLGRGPDARPTTVTFATPSFFPLLGAHALLGRFIRTDEDDASGGAPVAVLGHAFWQRQFGGDPAVVGRPLNLGNGVYTIIGIAPEGFRGVDFAATDVWLPSGASVREIFNDDAQYYLRSEWLHLIARTGRGVSVRQAETDASGALQTAYASQFGPGFNTIIGVTLESIIPGRGRTMSRDGTVSLWLTGMSAIVLLIACANVANLLLARATARRREIAVRIALGSDRIQLVRQPLAESALLAGIGGALGLALAWWGGRLARWSVLPDLATAGAIVDPRILAITALITVFTALLCGLAPAIQAPRTDVLSGLKAGAGGRITGHTRTALLVGQVALTTVLLISAGLFVRSLRSLRSIDLGIDASRLVVASMNLGTTGHSEAASNAIMAHILERVRALPGVEHASLAETAPFVSSYSWLDFVVPGREPASECIRQLCPLYISHVSPEYFATVGTPLLRGQGFATAHGVERGPIAIVNETAARTLWPGEDAIGQCLQVGSGGIGGSARDAPCSRVVGIVRDSRTMAVREEPRLQYFAPIDERRYASIPVLLVRTTGPPALLVGTIRRAMQEAGPNLPYANVSLLGAIIEPQLRPWRLGTMMFALFGALALALALCGVYGVFSYDVAQRTRELGVRLALGARPLDIGGLIASAALRASALGVTIGALCAVGVGRALTSLLVGISPFDPVVFAVTSGGILATTLVATYLPARYAARVDPTAALRAE